MSHDWSHRHWIIRSYPQPQAVWDVVVERDETCRKSLDGANVLLKWDGATPDLLQLAPQYTHAGILAILAGPDWSDPNPPPEDP